MAPTTGRAESVGDASCACVRTNSSRHPRIVGGLQANEATILIQMMGLARRNNIYFMLQVWGPEERQRKGGKPTYFCGKDNIL